LRNSPAPAPAHPSPSLPRGSQRIRISCPAAPKKSTFGIEIIDLNDTIEWEAADTIPFEEEEEDDSFAIRLAEMDEPVIIGGEGCVCWDTRPWLERQGQLMCWCGAPN